MPPAHQYLLQSYKKLYEHTIATVNDFVQAQTCFSLVATLICNAGMYMFVSDSTS